MVQDNMEGRDQWRLCTRRKRSRQSESLCLSQPHHTPGYFVCQVSGDYRPLRSLTLAGRWFNKLWECFGLAARRRVLDNCTLRLARLPSYRSAGSHCCCEPASRTASQKALKLRQRLPETFMQRPIVLAASIFARPPRK